MGQFSMKIIPSTGSRLDGNQQAHPARVAMVRVMDDPSGCVHGVVQIEVMTEG